MLNELFQLNSSMEAAGITKLSWHKDYKQCPKTKSFFLLIAADGTLCGLEPINDVERILSIRKYEVSNGVSFPAFNILPLLHAKSDEAKDAVKELKKVVKSKGKGKNEEDIVARLDAVSKTCENLWSLTDGKRIKKCLLSAGLRDRLGDAINNVPEDYRCLRELMERSKTLTDDTLKRSLNRLIKERILRYQDADEWLDTLLVSTAKTPKKVSLVLELADRSLFAYPVNHQALHTWINSHLVKQPVPSIGEPAAPQIDAFGKPITQGNNKETFPSVNLPQVGKVILRAMSSESPCQKRYGQIDAGSFPASGRVRQAMKDALEWLADKERKGRTWADASGACGYTKRSGKKVPISGLFLVYPSWLGDEPPELAALFAREDEASDPDGAKFEAAAARVTSALRLLVQEQPLAKVRVFVLAKADKARTKVLVSKKYNAHTLISGAREWKEGCKNIPAIDMNIGSEERAFSIVPLTPFPAEVVKCLNVAWLQEGTRTDNVHGLAIGEGVELLVGGGSSEQRVVRRALSLAIMNASPLLLALGHADHRRDGALKIDARYSGHGSLLPSLMGLLLYKQNTMKGEYMYKAPFLVGRLLALADLLHKEYCTHVRNGETPPQLIGNALMSCVMGNPVTGLARLAERIRIYQGWANTARGDGVGLAKWTLNEMGRVTSDLAALELPDRTNDADKAQILLGYLARPEDKGPEKATHGIITSDREVSNVGKSEQ